MALSAAGLLPAFDGLRLLDGEIHKAGYDLEIHPDGTLAISGSPPDESALPPARVQVLEKAVFELRQAVMAKQLPTETELNALAERYRQHIIRWFEYLTFQGMTPSARAINLPLEEVYVELRAVAEVPEAADAFSVEERRLLLEIKEDDPRSRDDLLRELDTLRRERWSRTIPERKSIAAALYQKDRRAFVVLGDPGSGKTTLLHFLALVHARGPERAADRLKIDSVEADRLPIFVPLASFDDMLRETPGLNLLEFLPRFYDRRRGLPGLGALFRKALETGRALILLDGLDEVLDTATRSYVAAQAGALIGEWGPRGVRFAVSSRFVGYREAPVPGNLPSLSVLDFGEREIETFVHQWAQVYERWAAGGGETPETFRRARELERDLLEDVKSNESVRRLAANPLMLTLLALLRRQVGKLPHRRVQLYESYVSTMLDNWIDARSQGAREKSRDSLDRHQAENILIPLALWLQKEKPSGTAGRVELEQRLTEVCLVEKGLKRETVSVPQLREAEDHARRFLKEMRETTGLLVERGHDAFGFLHLTFQEYFAGRALALLDARERWAMIRPHLHDPRWREPLLLCAGRLGVVENRRKDVTGLVREIIENNDDTEQDLHRNLLLALAIACDDVNLDPKLIEGIIDWAVSFIFLGVDALRKMLLGSLAQLAADRETSTLLGRCFGRIWDSGDRPLEVIATEALGRFAEVEEIRDILLRNLNHEEWTVRKSAVDALASEAEGDDRVRSRLIEKTRDPFEQVRLSALRSLSGLVSRDPEVFTSFLEQLGDERPPVSTEAADALGRALSDVDKRFQDLLFKRLESESFKECSAAIRASSALLPANGEVRSKILSMLDNKETRWAAIAALSPLVPHDEEVRSRLVGMLKRGEGMPVIVSAFSEVINEDQEVRRLIVALSQDDNEDVRYAAVRALAQQAWTDAHVRKALLDRLSDSEDFVQDAAMVALIPCLYINDVRALFTGQADQQSWEVRQTLARSLGEHGGEGSFPILCSLCENMDALEAYEYVATGLECIAGLPEGKSRIFARLADTSAVVRASAVKSLSLWVETDSTVRRAILDRLEDCESNVRSAAVEALSSVVGSDSEVRQAIIDIANDKEEEWFVCSSALTTLSGLLNTNLEVRQLVLKHLYDPKAGEHIRTSALRALASLVKTDLEVRQIFLDRLHTREDSEYVRAVVVEGLSKIGGAVEGIQQALLGRLHDEGELDYVRAAATRALSNLVGQRPEVRQVLLDLLGNREESVAVRASAVRALSRLLALDSETRRVILNHLYDQDESEYVRSSVMEALSSVVLTDPEVRGIVLGRFLDLQEGRFLRSTAWRTLSVPFGTNEEFRRLLRVNEDTWSKLLPWLGWDDESYGGWIIPAQRHFTAGLAALAQHDSALKTWVWDHLRNPRGSARVGAILTLTAWPGGPPSEIRDSIYLALEDRRGLESYPARLTATSFLINRNEHSKKSIDLCLEALDYGTQPWEHSYSSSDIRRQAALVLGTLEPLEHVPQVYERLLRVMKEDEEPAVRDAAYEALVRLAGARERQVAAT